MSDEWAIVLVIIGIMSPIVTAIIIKDKTKPILEKFYIIHEMDKRIVS